jgi:hypothetical protein
MFSSDIARIFDMVCTLRGSRAYDDCSDKLHDRYGAHGEIQLIHCDSRFLVHTGAVDRSPAIVPGGTSLAP